MEIWKDVKGYEGLCKVSNKGNVIKYGLLVDFLTYKGGRGSRFVVNIKKDNINRVFQVHRLVAEAFIPNPENLPVVHHKDNNPFNNSSDNLEWTTQDQNLRYSRNIRGYF